MSSYIRSTPSCGWIECQSMAEIPTAFESGELGLHRGKLISIDPRLVLFNTSCNLASSIKLTR